jgi:hypothetical protein
MPSSRSPEYVCSFLFEDKERLSGDDDWWLGREDLGGGRISGFVNCVSAGLLSCPDETVL